MQVNPALLVKRVRHTPAERRPLLLDQILRLIDAVDEHAPERLKTRDKAILKVFFHCSLRVTEVSSLDLVRVDRERRYFLDVRRKGDKVLSAHFNDVVAEALEQYLVDRPVLLRNPGESALFLSQRGTRLAVRTIEEMVSHYARKAGILDRTTPHILRHSSATELADLTDMFTIRDQLGHEDIRTTETYVHVKAGKLEAASQALGQRWKEAEAGRVHA